MTNNASLPRIGYIVKMYPRLSETFILNEILQHEKCGADISIFSYKKPDEGQFHPQVSQVRAKVTYLEDYDPRKWHVWLGRIWNSIDIYHDRFLTLFDRALSKQDTERIELLLAAALVASHARRLGITHFHAHFASIPSTIAYLASQISGIPFSFTAHAKDIFVYDMTQHLLREKLAAASFIVTVTNYNFRYLTEHAPEIDPKKIKVIYNGVDLERFTPNPENGRESGLILGVGRLVPKKGFTYLLEACALLRRMGVNFKCLIVGEGPDREGLLIQQRELGLESLVTFAGARRHDEILDLMQRATLLCLPCTVADDGNQDALPTVLLEALAVGLPCVSTTVSGIPEIIDSGNDGLLVPPNDALSLKDAIEKLLSKPSLRAQFAEVGRHKATARFDLVKNAGQLLAHFRNSGQIDLPGGIDNRARKDD